MDIDVSMTVSGISVCSVCTMYIGRAYIFKCKAPKTEFYNNKTNATMGSSGTQRSGTPKLRGAEGGPIILFTEKEQEWHSTSCRFV